VLTELGTWLRQQREARGWARREMARRLIQAARAAGDKAVPGIDGMCHNIRRWERGHGDLTERYKLYYCTTLGITPSQFGTAPPPGTQAPVVAASPCSPAASSPTPSVAVTPDVVGPRPSIPLTVAYRGIPEPDLGWFTVEREVLMVAHEGSDHAEQAEDHGIGDITFDQLRADLIRLAHQTDIGEPFTVFLDMRRVRGRIYRLLDRRLWPREQTDLYFLLGCLNGLMGVAANRLGYPDSAEELIRAGSVYATAIDHRPLLAQLHYQLSYVAYWRGRFEESRDQAAGGLEYLSEGPPGAELHLYHARAAARLGDTDMARQAIAAAHDARERDYTDDLLEIGGEFAMSWATHHCFAGAALAGIWGAESEAAEQLERAIGLYDAGPGSREEYSFSCKPLAGIDLAVIRLRSGALDAAAAALEPVLSLHSALRVSAFTTRLAAVRDELAAPVFRGSPQARDLGAQIEEFSRETTVAGLHSLSGGPG
jgi:hypothetical protein